MTLSIDSDTPTALRQLAHHAVAQVSGAVRGSLLVRDGQQLVYKAAIGYHPADLRSLLWTSNDFPFLNGSLVMIGAAEWYQAYLPESHWLAGPPPPTAWMIAVPITLRERTCGVLSVEQPTAAPPAPELQTALEQLASQAAWLLERQDQYHEITQLVQEVQLLNSMLHSAGGATSVRDALPQIGDAILSALPYRRWRAITLALRDAQPHSILMYQTYDRPINAYWRNVSNGAYAAGQDLGVEVVFVGTGIGETAQEEVLDTAIRQRVDGIAVAPINAAALEPAIRRARQAGIPLVAFDTPPVADSHALLYIGTDNVAAGRLAGEVMIRLVPEGGLLGMGATTLQANNTRQRIEGINAAIAGTALQPRPVLEDLLDMGLALENARHELAEHPELVGAIGVCSGNGPGWANAALELGRAGQFKIVAFDILADTIATLKEGTIQAAIAQREYAMGYHSVQILSEMVVDGVEAALQRLPASRFIDTGVDVVTLERTAWSLAVADYLAPPRSGVIDRRLRQALAQRGNPITILVAGMGGQSQERAAAQRVPLPTGSFFSQVIAAEQPIIVDPFAPGELAGGDLDGFRGRNLRTVVGVPLWQHDQVIGVLCLESEQADACAPEDLMRLQRIADTISVFLANTRLIEQVQERTRELEGANQTQELLLRTVMDLSSPIVPIARHILVMPLVGAIDSRRAGHFIETVLSEIGTRQAQVVLIDITGVSLVDTGVANYLIRAAQAARLLGAEVVLVGITPSVAQTMVSLGIDLAQMVTRADLEGGFVYALARTGGRIVYGASVTQS